MKFVLFVLFLSFTMVGFAKPNSTLPIQVQAAIDNLKQTHVRVVTKEINLIKELPCLPVGKSYDAQIQVRRAIAVDRRNSELIYEWNTIKTVNVGLDGKITEACME